MATATGSYQQVDGQPVVRFERTFPHPVDVVWEAISNPAQLETWFPTTVEFAALHVDEPITFRFAEDRYPAMTGTILEVTPPERLVFTWAADRLTFELAPREGGAACRLTFSVVLDSPDKAARDSAGWDQCLDRLARSVAGGPAAGTPGGVQWRAYYEEYKRRGLPATAPLPE